MWTTLLAGLALAADPAPADDWQKSEAAHLENIRQVTADFVRAGEGYFSPDGRRIIFQAEEKDTGNPFYQIFVMDLASGKATRVSPGQGRTTCPYFSPDGKRILFGSGHEDPDVKKTQEAEYKLREEERKAGKRRRYSWDFDPYMEVYEADPDGGNLKKLTDSKGYDAECSYSPDGKQILFASNRNAKEPGHCELFIMNRDGSDVRQVTKAPGCYNGGPFFSPDGKRIIFRSDRKEKDRLQLYVINTDGTGEKALTDNDKWVYWAPFWHSDGRHIIYTAADHSNELARPNYDVYWMDTETGRTARLTHAPGQDVLPVFSPDCKRLMWTSNRDGRSPTQLYIADFVPPKSRG